MTGSHSLIEESKQKCVSSDISFSEITFNGIENVRTLISHRISILENIDEPSVKNLIKDMLEVSNALYSITNDTDAIILK